MTAVVVGALVGALAFLAAGGVPRSGVRAVRTPVASTPRAPGNAVDVLLATVAASLRAGTPPAHAWAHAGVLATPDGVPHAGSLALRIDGSAREDPDDDSASDRPDDARAPRSRPGRRRRHGHTAARERRAQVAALVAASRVAARLGAPLADTLEHVGREAVAAETRAARRRAALAGPRATARLLAWLPLLGLLVASLLGGDPVSTVLGGGAGAVSVTCGALALAVGRRWIRVLVRQAERP